MHPIQFTESINIDDKSVTSITVRPLSFIEFSQLWASVGTGAKVEVRLQRARMLQQTIFKAGDEELNANEVTISSLPIAVGKSILAALDIGQGKMGEIIQDGDGVTEPILMKLGTPIEMDKSGKTITISELEFQATMFCQIEDALAAGNDVDKALSLLESIATPVGVDNMTNLPHWVIGKITTADGVLIMQKVLPAF